MSKNINLVAHLIDTNRRFHLIKLYKEPRMFYLGEMLTSKSQGFRFSSSMTSNPNNSWQHDLKMKEITN